MLNKLLLSSAIALALAGCDHAATESPMPDTTATSISPPMIITNDNG